MDTVVLSSLSLRASRVIDKNANSSDILAATSIRAARVARMSITDSNVLEHSSLPIAGFEHAIGKWEAPKKMDYVVIHMQ